MKKIPFPKAHSNLAAVINQVCREHNTVTIIRNRQPSVVLIARNDYASLMETAHLLHTPANANRLLASISNLTKKNCH